MQSRFLCFLHDWPSMSPSLVCSQLHLSYILWNCSFYQTKCTTREFVPISFLFLFYFTLLTVCVQEGKCRKRRVSDEQSNGQKSRRDRGKERDTVTWTSSLTKQKLFTEWTMKNRGNSFTLETKCLFCLSVSPSLGLPFIFTRLLSISFYSALTELDLINLYERGKCNIIKTLQSDSIVALTEIRLSTSPFK